MFDSRNFLLFLIISPFVWKFIFSFIAGRMRMKNEYYRKTTTIRILYWIGDLGFLGFIFFALYIGFSHIPPEYKGE